MFSIYRLLRPALYQRLVWQRGRDLVPFVRAVSWASGAGDTELGAAPLRGLLSGVAVVVGDLPWTTRTYDYPRPAAGRRRR